MHILDNTICKVIHINVIYIYFYTWIIYFFYEKLIYIMFHVEHVDYLIKCYLFDKKTQSVYFFFDILYLGCYGREKGKKTIKCSYAVLAFVTDYAFI